MGNFNLSEAAKAILAGKQDSLTEDSKSTFDANIKAKQSQRGGEKAPHGEVGADKLPTSTVAGQQDVGEIGQSPEEENDMLPDYTKGTPTATPPGATPPVGAQGDGVGASKPQNQPQETMGRSDLTHATQSAATDYAAIRDRIMGKMPAQMMHANPGAHFQSYAEEAEYDDESLTEEEKMMMKKDAMMKKEMKEKKMMHDKMKMKEDIDAMLSGENLSEEFKTKATTIFEAAVLSRAEAVIAEAENALMEEFEVAVEQVKEDLATKVDEYLTYFTEEWVKENQIAIQSGLKSEIVEDFMTGLRNLFVEHYIEIPEEKVDVVEQLTAKVTELEESLNDEISNSVAMLKELNEHKKFEAIYTACEGLTQTQVEKMKSLAENVDFTTEEEFVEKLESIKESYFKQPVKTADSSALDDEVQLEEDDKKATKASVDSLVESVAKTITQSQKVW